MESTHWWYRVRREIAVDILRQLIVPGHSEANILDVGCGAGGLMAEAGVFGDVCGIDISSQAVGFCRGRGISKVHVGDATAIPYPTCSFDIVIAMDVVEHIKDDRIALSEIHRVLKPGGYCVITVPAFQELWGITDELSHHYRRYRRGEIAKQMEAANLVVKRSTYFNTLLFAPIALIRLAVRLMGITMDSENASPRFVNGLLYRIFHLEVWLLRLVDFPFGVSVLAVVQKS